MSHKLKLAFGKSELSNAVENASLSWEKLLTRLSDFKVMPNTRSYMLTGHCPSGVRGQKRGDEIKESHLLMLDFDNKEAGEVGFTFEELEFDLSLLFDFHWALYTTRSFAGDNVRFRVIVPFASGLSASKHRAAVEHIMGILPPHYLKWLDSCSYRADQPIFLPCVLEEGSPCHSSNGGERFIEFNNKELAEDINLDESSGDSLEDLLTAQPLDLTKEEVLLYLEALDPNGMDYGSDAGGFGWADVGMAIAHQFGGSDEGLETWINWSERNKEKHDPKTMPAKYRSFDVLPRGRKPITFASVIAKVKEQGGMMALVEVENGDAASDEAPLLDRFIEKAQSVETIEQYNRFKKRVVNIDRNLLPDDARAILSFALFNSFGKSNGINRSIINKALQPVKKESADDDSGAKLPSWAEGWCYIEKTCEFYHIPSDHAINREAFNARFDRQEECRELDSSAAQLVLTYRGLPTYADKMYWPGAATTFTDSFGKEMVNSYICDGVVPSKVISEAGQKVIDRMIIHLKMLIPDDREFRIVLNWLTYVYQNPGKRVNWALLIQGAQGTGKSYFSVLMSHLLGRNARTLEAGAIAERFTGWAHGSVLTTIEEVRISGTSKFNILDRMKTYISNETVQIEEKGRDHRVVPNFTNYLMLTNHKDALPMTDGDRRYCVIYTDIQSENQLFNKLGGKEAAAVYFDTLFSLSREYICDIAAFFRDRTICGDFQPQGRAPETAARTIMQSLSVSSERADLESAISSNSCAVINESVIDVTWLGHLSRLHDVEIPKTRALSAILVDMGYEPLRDRVYNAKTRALHTVWRNPYLTNEGEVAQLVKDFHRGDDESKKIPF